MQRLCQNQLMMGPAAVETIMKRCRQAMNGEAAADEEEMFVYTTAGPPSFCHHHSIFESYGLPVEYQAYRFSVVVHKKDRPMFQSLLQAEFESVEQRRNLDNFGSGPHGRRGSIKRSFAWMGREEAAAQNVAGLNPPEERLHIIQETEPLSAVMFGIEGSAPHKESFFGGKHGVNGASKDLSPFGSRKWRDYRRGGQEVPADIGGMRMRIDQEAFRDLCSLMEVAPLSRPSTGYSKEPQASFERKLFRALLVASDEEAASILSEHLSFGRPSLQPQTGTMILDSDVKERSTSFKSVARQDASHGTIGSKSGIALDDSDDEEPDKSAGLRPEPESGQAELRINVEPGSRKHQPDVQVSDDTPSEVHI